MVRRRRVVALLAVTSLGIGGLAVAVDWGGGGSDRERAGAPPPELPRGGRRIFPGKRVVAFYGAPQADELGVLGVGTLSEAVRRLERQALSYRRRGRPVLPALELIAVIASGAPGDDGGYSFRQTKQTVRRHLAAARRRRALLILDIQPGRASFMGEVRALEEFLREPDVSLALDPEWSVGPGQVPGQQIGSIEAETVNEVSRYLSRIVRRNNLPQKLLVIHRFTHDMIRNESAIRLRKRVALTMNVDGFGGQEIKIAKYRDFTRGRRRRFNGFKLFYREDTDLLSPRQVLALRPRPDLIVYE